ncbi:unnamed protein product [Adineta steineri]|uniref:Uncharacterized protein n=1 Tax=Adineta steineri TaxID=433720 RepID=A0A814M758_9BILA|nr:unnamed protein product [Adineta steineri]CAF1141292.1 unnamed protein product [Adineta steineri]
MISTSSGYFTGCPMDGCETTLSGFVDLSVDKFNEHVEWQRTDLLTISSRGCISNEQTSLICAVDTGYVSINATNGQILWSIPLDIEEKTIAVSLPVINYQGFLIIANSTRCTLINPQGAIVGIFNYIPRLIPPLAGPFVTDDGQIIVADSVSFVGIEDSGIPLGVQAFPPGLLRLSRSMSLNSNIDRWYLIAQRNSTLSQVIIAAETTGSIVDRLRIAWIYEYGIQTDSCSRMEGPLLSIDRKWLFVVNITGILIIADDGDSARTEHIVILPNLCINDMVYSETDSTLLLIDTHTYNMIMLNVSTRNISYISLKDICQEEIIGQLSRMTIIQNNRVILVVITATHKAILLLIDFNHRNLLARLDLGYVPESTTLEPLTQLAYTAIDEKQYLVTIAHKTIGLIAVRLLTDNQ